MLSYVRIMESSLKKPASNVSILYFEGLRPAPPRPSVCRARIYATVPWNTTIPEQDMSCTYQVTLARVRVIILAV
jgi:hypothetical protein